MGLQGMIGEMLDALRRRPRARMRRRRSTRSRRTASRAARSGAADHRARERHASTPSCATQLRAARASAAKTPVLGITGTGGAGKCSLTDELVRRFRLDQDDALQIAVLSIDPSRRKTGGALLGDRIRMNAIDAPEHLHALARHARRRQRDLRRRCPTCIAACKAAGFDLVIVETVGHRPGRRGDRAARRRLAVRDDAGVRRGEPAREDRHARLRRLRRDQQVRPQGRRRTRCATCASRSSATARRSSSAPDEMPVFGTIAARFNDDGVTALYQALVPRSWPSKGLKLAAGHAAAGRRRATRTHQMPIVPPARARYLAEIADTVRGYHAARARRRRSSRASASSCARAQRMLEADGKPTRRRSTRSIAEREARARRRARRSCSTMWPRHAAGLRRRRVRRQDPRQGDPHRARPRRRCPAPRSARSRCRATRTTARSCAG